MKFYATNKKSDPGFDKTPDEVATEFWDSHQGRAWMSREGRLERLSIEFMSVTYGGWDPEDRSELDEVLNAIFATRPKET